MRFIDEKHAINFKNMIIKDMTDPTDKERSALLYILSSNDFFCKKIDFIYNFDEHCISIECLTEQTIDLCSSAKSLIRLGFNLYNGYEDAYTTPNDIFYIFDKVNYFVALQAIKVRFGNENEKRIIQEGVHEVEFERCD